jgi:hypothetical protein
MEVSEVRRRISETIERARRDAARRRTLTDEAAREWPTFLERVAIPLFRQVANVLKVENYAFTVFTPGSSVRLMSDRRQEDFAEVTLDASGNEPVVMGRTSRARGGHVTVTELPIASGRVTEITDEELLAFLIEWLAPLVER